MTFKFSVAGHRGQGCTDSDFAKQQGNAGTRYPENTLPSFQAALGSPIYADMIETDLIRTKDDRIVHSHSTDFAQHVALAHRPAGKKYIDDMPLAEVAKLKLGEDGEARIPTLRSLLEVTAAKRQGNDLVLNLEIKDVQGTDCPRRRPSIGQLALQEINEAKFPLERIRFSSFSLDAIADMARLAPKARLGMLFDLPQEQGGDVGKKMFADSTETYLGFTPKMIAAVLARVPSLEALHPEIQSLTPDTVNLAAKHGLAIATWGWLEESPKQSAKFAQATQQAIELCSKNGVPLTIITDHVKDVRSFAQPFLPNAKKPGRHQPSNARITRPGW